MLFCKHPNVAHTIKEGKEQGGGLEENEHHKRILSINFWLNARMGAK